MRNKVINIKVEVTENVYDYNDSTGPILISTTPLHHLSSNTTLNERDITRYPSLEDAVRVTLDNIRLG